jgi:hypothetical protein
MPTTCVGRNIGSFIAISFDFEGIEKSWMQLYEL